MHEVQLTLSEFSKYLQSVGYGTTSVYMLPYCAGEFLSYMGAGDSEDIHGIAAPDIVDFYEWLQVRPLRRREGRLSGAMIDHYGYALRVFFNWLEFTDQIDMNPVSGLRLPRWGVGERFPLSAAEIGLLFDHAKTVQERVILHLFYSCGLRRSEAAALHITDISFSRGVLYVRRGKGMRRRVIPLPAGVAACFECYYITEREPMLGVGDRDSFMLNRIGQRMRGSSLSAVVDQVAERAGMEEVVTPHRLRHSIATHLLERGMDMEQVRAFLGHQCLETTQRYAKTDEAKILAL